MRRDRARGVTISAGGFKICLELLIRSEPSLVIEVPYVFKGRTVGESKMNLKEATGYLVQLRDLHAYRRHCRGLARALADHRIMPSGRLAARAGGTGRFAIRRSCASAICPKIDGLVAASFTMSPRRPAR